MSSSPVWKTVERQFGRLIREHTGREYDRGSPLEARLGNIGDLRWTDLPLVAQVRSGYSVSMRKSLHDAQAAQRDGEIPIGVCYFRPRRRGEPAGRYVVLDWDDFARMAGQLTRSEGWTR